MPSQTVRSGESPARSGRERLGVVVIAVGIVGVIAAYLALNANPARDGAKDLLPYQTLVSSLPEQDQLAFRAIREGLLGAEADRARRGAWPEQPHLASGYEWSRLDQGAIINYFGAPGDPAAPAWLLEIQEPEPGMAPDPAPVDDEHHRLPDGTMLHTYVWMHRYGAQVPVGFVRQPQNSGWTEVFSTPPNPVFYNRR
jgi:hypothetical protein